MKYLPFLFCLFPFFIYAQVRPNYETNTLFNVQLARCMLPMSENQAPTEDWLLKDSAIYIDSVPMESKWKIDKYFSFGYKGVVGEKPNNYSTYGRGNGICNFTFREILEEFEIYEPVYLKPKARPKPFENDRYSLGWYFFKKKEYLIMRAVSNYPNGNQTSWYYEATYIFKPAK